MPEANQLDDVVISASKYEQKLGDVPVSMAMIKPALIENKATRDAQAIVEQVPGVQSMKIKLASEEVVVGVMEPEVEY